MADDRIVEAALAFLATEPAETAVREWVARPPPVHGSSGDAGAALRRRMDRVGARLLGLAPAALPPRLVELGEGNPAPLVTTTAPPDAFVGPAVAVVGTRRATAAGLEIARHLGAYLARAGVVVVSGLARGVDAAVHRGVVEEGGRGIAVLGSGIDVIYPRRHAPLAARLEHLGGGLVSQYAPGAEPFPWRFPKRNRLLAALGDGVVVVEAHSSGGALITAEAALDLGKEVMAVPGSPLVPAAAGCNRLLRDGAAVVAEFSDVLSAVGLCAPTAPSMWSDSATDPLARRIVDLLTSEPLAIETIVRLVRRDASEVSRAVARLELAGVVARERGGVRRRAAPR